MQSADNRIIHFFFNVIALLLTNSSKCFLYSLVPLNQISNFLDPLTKHTDAKRNKGVVGNNGNTIPTMPNPRKKNPRDI